MRSLGKQAVSTGSINQPVEIALLFLSVCFKTIRVSTPLNLSLVITLFLQNGRVLYSFENKAYLKPCRALDKSVIQISYFSTKNISCGYSKEPSQ